MPSREAGAARATAGTVVGGGRPRAPSREAGAAPSQQVGGHARRRSRRAAAHTVGPGYPRTVDTAREE